MLTDQRKDGLGRRGKGSGKKRGFGAQETGFECLLHPQLVV